MTRKRKTEEVAPMDEADRTIYSTFCGAANSLSQLYTQAMHQQTLSFDAGERHALEKLYQWILRQHEVESRLTVADVVTHIQNEMDYGGDDLSTSPMLEFQQQTQSASHFTNSSIQPFPGLSGQVSTSIAPRSGDSDHAKSSAFSNALSSSACGSLPHYRLAQGGGYYANGPSTGDAGARSHDPNQNQELHSLSFNDSSMDMNPDSPKHESYL
ncbi:unnamed protein product [Musa hybrid cultivar]